MSIMTDETKVLSPYSKNRGYKFTDWYDLSAINKIIKQDWYHLHFSSNHFSHSDIRVLKQGFPLVGKSCHCGSIYDSMVASKADIDDLSVSELSIDIPLHML